MKQRFVTFGLLTLAFLLPTVAVAATKLPEALGVAFGVIQDMVVVTIGLAVLVFLWGVLKYVIASDDNGKAKGRTYMLWGIIGLFVMVSVWGLVYMIQQTFGLRDPGRALDAPRIEVPNAGSAGGAQTVQGAVERIMNVIQALSPVLLGLGALLFIWGVFNYVRTENAQDKAKASAYIAWGIGILFVLSSVWSLVFLIGQTVGINTERGTRLEGKTGVQINSLIKK